MRLMRRCRTTGRKLREFPQNKRAFKENHRIIRLSCPRLTAKMPKRQNPSKAAKMVVDTNSGKRERGRPRKCRHDEILGRAANYRGIFTNIWLNLSGHLLTARTEDEVTEAFVSHGEPYAREFAPRLSADILSVMREKKFPKRTRAQIKFLANSLAGRPNVEPRTSRDICAKRLAEEKTRSPHKILRKEYYVECSCGFKGPALNDACRKCGAQISFLPELLRGVGLV
jgi:hypothetical protein